MHRSVLENEEFIAWANEHVVVLVGHGRGSHGTVDVVKPAKGEPKKQCALYPGLTCEQHDQVTKDSTGKDDARDDAKPDGKAKKPAKKKEKAKDNEKDAPPAFPVLKFDGIPASFVVTPEGETEAHKSDREPGACRTRLEEGQKAFDEHPILASQWAAVKAAWTEVEKAAKATKGKATLEAVAATEAVVGGALPKVWAERVKAKVDAVDAKATAKLADLKKLKDPAAAQKAIEALRAELDVALAAGPLPVLARIDAALGREPAAAPPAAPPAADGPGEPAGEPAPAK